MEAVERTFPAWPHCREEGPPRPGEALTGSGGHPPSSRSLRRLRLPLCSISAGPERKSKGMRPKVPRGAVPKPSNHSRHCPLQGARMRPRERPSDAGILIEVVRAKGSWGPPAPPTLPPRPGSTRSASRATVDRREEERTLRSRPRSCTHRCAGGRLHIRPGVAVALPRACGPSATAPGPLRDALCGGRPSFFRPMFRGGRKGAGVAISPARYHWGLARRRKVPCSCASRNRDSAREPP
jgi:hypothetical protein